MRIITGQYKGRTIQAPKGIRPTEERVRKAFFDIMADVSGMSFLELFAGSGAMGFEALSQGASTVLFVEKDRQAVKAIEINLKKLGISSQAELVCADVLQFIPVLAKNKRKFDLIFLDPPYYRGMAEKTLQILAEYDILQNPGYLIIQHFKRDPLPDRQGGFVLFKQSRYSDALLSFYRKEGNP